MQFKNFPRSLIVAGGVALIGVVGASSIAADQTNNRAAAFAIKYRQSVYTVMYGNFAPLGAMVKGTAPYDAAKFTQRAERVAYLAQLAGEAFPAESQSGATTAAKPEIWTNRAEFDKLMKNWQDKTVALAKVANGGNLDAIKPAFGAVVEACKACHDKFRVEEKH